MHAISPEWASAIAAYLAAQRASSAAKSTMYTRRQHLEHLARRVDAGPWKLTGEELVEYVDAQEWARETARGRRVTLDSFYRWAKRARHVKRSPAKVLEKVKPGDPNPSPVPDDVYLTALARADDEEALWIDLAAEHGLRRAEIARIHSDDIVPTLLGHDLIVHGKGGKLRRVPLTSAMHRAAAARIARQGRGYLFRGDEDGHISARWLGKRVNRLFDGPWTIHKLRHRAATRFYVMAGGDPYPVAELMGWANINMVRVYVRLPESRLRGIVEAASRHGAALRSPAWTP